MLFQVKHQPEDFIVEELLPQLPAGQGDIFYVYIEKRNLTTMEVVEFLQRSFHLSREDIGIAGLKDKVGITRQWISLFKRKLEQIGGESAFLAVLNEQVNVLQTSRGTQPLRVGGNAGNKFTVRLRATSTVSEPVKMLIEKNIENVQTKGFPNCFGTQRFGKRNKNFWEAKNILTNQSTNEQVNIGEHYHLRFMLQAYASMYFNVYAMMRREKGLHLLSGDIMVNRYYATGAQVGIYQEGSVKTFDYEQMKQKNADKAMWSVFPDDLHTEYELTSGGNSTLQWFPTGPMLGWNLLVAPKGSKANVREEQLFALAAYDEQLWEAGKRYHLRGVRRPLWVQVDDLQWKWEGDDVCLQFSLPTGSYATVLLAFILAEVDPLTLKDNKLEIPRIE